MKRLEAIAKQATKQLGWERQDVYNLRSVAKRITVEQLDEMLDRIEAMLTPELSIPQTMWLEACKFERPQSSRWSWLERLTATAGVVAVVVVHAVMFSM